MARDFNIVDEVRRTTCSTDDIAAHALLIEAVWGEFADEPVIAAAEDAAKALRKLYAEIQEMRGA